MFDMSDFVIELFEEHDQLYLRIEKLKKFIQSAEFKKVKKIERAHLRDQLHQMNGYIGVLEKRILGRDRELNAK